MANKKEKHHRKQDDKHFKFFEELEKAKTLLEIGEEKLSQCKTIKGKRAIRKTNKHLREIIRGEKK